MGRRGHRCRCCSQQECASSLIVTITGLKEEVPAFSSFSGMFAKGIAPLSRYNGTYRLFRSFSDEDSSRVCTHVYHERISSQFVLDNNAHTPIEITKRVTWQDGTSSNFVTNLELTFDDLYSVLLRRVGDPLQKGQLYSLSDFVVLSLSSGLDLSSWGVIVEDDNGQDAITPCECYSLAVSSEYQANCLEFTGKEAPVQESVSQAVLQNDDVAVSCSPADGWCREYGDTFSVQQSGSTLTFPWRSYGDDQLEVELSDFDISGAFQELYLSTSGTYYLPYVGNSAFGLVTCGFGLANPWGVFASPQHCWASAFEFEHLQSVLLCFVSVTIPTRLERCSSPSVCANRKSSIHVSVLPVGPSTTLYSGAYVFDQDDYTCGNFAEVSGGPSGRLLGSCNQAFARQEFQWTIRQA